MYQQFTFILLWTALQISCIHSFAAYSSASRLRVPFPRSTCLQAEEAPGDAAAPEESSDSADAQEDVKKEDSAEKEEEKKTEAVDNILNSPAFLKRKIDVLKTDITKADEDLDVIMKTLEENKAEWETDFQRIDKEVKIMQERMSDDMKMGKTQAVFDVAKTMLEFLDNIDRATKSVTVDSDAEKEVEAEYRKSYDMYLAAFTKLGISQIETVGKEFDYTFHQAIMQKPSDEYEEGFVCEEFEKGFVIGEMLIRPALVAVVL